jgi:hypothetical protein
VRRSENRFLHFITVITVAVMALLPIGTTPARGATEDDASRHCSDLRHVDFSQVTDALTSITDATVVPSSHGQEFCEVTGYVVSGIGFLIRLPTAHWNGKLLEIGCGGFCGNFEHARLCIDALRRGYACIVSDGGHRAGSADFKWAYNNLSLKIDLFVRAAHVSALAGKAIAQRYYDQAPRKSYFWGCSGGGSQAMEEAERFPWDFDGIIAGAAISWAGAELNLLWENRAFTSASGEPLFRQADLELLHGAVVAKCDMNDGVMDGLIGDPRLCHFNPSDLQCAVGKGVQCLSPQQVEAARKIYGGPVDSTGQQIVLPTALRGSELQWLEAFYGIAPRSEAEERVISKAQRDWQRNGPGSFTHLIAEIFRYNVFDPDPGPSWQLQDFDFDRDPKRIGMLQSLLEPINPDLRPFKAADGKLLLYDGWTDVMNQALRDVDFYESAQRVSGGRASTEDFFRMFIIPGGNHCRGGDGAWVVDYLSALEGWVEKGHAPEKLIGVHLRTDDPADTYGFGERGFPLDPRTIEFSRPIYPYPIRTRYLGHGDPKEATSFGPAEP